MITTGLNNQRVRNLNKELLLKLLYQKKVASKSRLSTLSQLSIPAVSNILAELVQEGSVLRSPQNLHSRGVGGGSYQAVGYPHPILCLHITPYYIESLLVNGLIEPYSELHCQPITISTPEQLLKQIESLFNNYRQQSPASLCHLAIALHGQVNPLTGQSQRMPQAPWSTPVELKYLLEERLRTRLLLDNDCVMLALAEKWLNLRQQDFSVINVDYGIGSSFMLQQQIYCGNLYGSGQIGHTIVDVEGALCACGRYGCLETIASLPALQQQLRHQLQDSMDIEQIDSDWLITQYHEGNLRVQEQVNHAANMLGISLYNMLNIINISDIYLYGRSCRFGQAWLDRVAQLCRPNPFDSGLRDPLIFYFLNNTESPRI